MENIELTESKNYQEKTIILERQSSSSASDSSKTSSSSSSTSQESVKLKSKVTFFKKNVNLRFWSKSNCCGWTETENSES